MIYGVILIIIITLLLVSVFVWHPDPTTQNLQDHNPLYFTFHEQTSHQQITKAIILWLYKRRLDVVIDDPVVIIDVYRVDTNNMHQSIVANIQVSSLYAMTLV